MHACLGLITCAVYLQPVTPIFPPPRTPPPRGLDHIRREAEGLLVRLEEHYYSSAHKGQQQQPQRDPAAATLAELCAQAQAMIDDLHLP